MGYRLEKMLTITSLLCFVDADSDEKRRAVHLAEAVYLRCGGYVQVRDT